MIDFFLDAYKNTSTLHVILEFLVFVFGILSVWYAKKENIWVYVRKFAFVCELECSIKISISI